MCENASDVSAGNSGAHSLRDSWQLALRGDSTCSLFDRHLVGVVVFPEINEYKYSGTATA
jgi:hypothetical protein